MVGSWKLFNLCYWEGWNINDYCLCYSYNLYFFCISTAIFWTKFTLLLICETFAKCSKIWWLNFTVNKIVFTLITTTTNTLSLAPCHLGWNHYLCQVLGSVHIRAISGGYCRGFSRTHFLLKYSAVEKYSQLSMLTWKRNL